MLRVKSFQLSDDEGINELLNNYRIANGASIFVSNGEICVPYEDGEPDNLNQRVIGIKEQINALSRERELVLQSQLVLTEQIDRRQARLDTLNADLEETKQTPNAKGRSKVLDDMKKVIDQAQKSLEQDRNQHLSNDREIERLDLNIEKLQERIKELNGAG